MGIAGQRRAWRRDSQCRYLGKRGGIVLDVAAELRESDDHRNVATRVHQAPADHGSLAAMTEVVARECGERPDVVMADAGYYSMEQITAVETRGVEVYVPDRLIAGELAGGAVVVEMNARQQRRHPGLQQLRERMRGPTTRPCYARRKALVEPVFGVLKQQRGMRQFRRRGLRAVGTEWALATTAYNLTRLFRRIGSL